MEVKTLFHQIYWRPGSYIKKIIANYFSLCVLTSCYSLFLCDLCEKHSVHPVIQKCLST